MKLMVYCTCPDSQVAQSIAASLVEQHAAACVNILPGVSSIYSWQGEIHEDAEVLLLIKSDRNHFQGLSDIITGLHPYEVPEIVAVPLEAGYQPYLEWMDACLTDS
ncbi:MAG: divalent-cation tolerance protein CutA [Pseudomonadota bacterium]